MMNATVQKKIVPGKVLITGASGLLGVAAIKKFLSAGWVRNALQSLIDHKLLPPAAK
jgi:nucleoside-diphosphate-sugar epimerase